MHVNDPGIGTQTEFYHDVCTEVDLGIGVDPTHAHIRTLSHSQQNHGLYSVSGSTVFFLCDFTEYITHSIYAVKKSGLRS